MSASAITPPTLPPSSGHTSVNTLLDAGDLAERWRVPRSQVYRLTRTGGLPVLKLGKHFRYRLESIERWEREQEGRSDA